MRRLVVCALLVTSCTAQAPAKDDCDAARRLFAHCGVLLPLLETPTCSGFTKTLARCIEKTNGDCDALASLSSQLDACTAEAENELPPVEDVPLPAGADGGAEGGVDAATSDASTGSTDLQVPTTDLQAAPDLSLAWAGFSFDETVTNGQTHQHQTPVLAPGTYVFTLSGTGDADLYVRIGQVPTQTLYDCAPQLATSSEACTIALTTTDRIYVVVRGFATTSAYHLDGREQ